MAKIGETISKEEFSKLYPIGTTLSTQDFQKQYQPQQVEQQKPKSSALFPVTGKEGSLGIAGKTLGNIPKSAYEFGKGIVTSPLQAVKMSQQIGRELGTYAGETGENPWAIFFKSFKETPKSAYQVLVPDFIKSLISGDTENATKRLAEDPVGQIAPIIMAMRMGAKASGKGVQFDNAMTNLSKVVTTPAKIAAQKTVSGVGNLASQALGVSTGAGKVPIQEAFKAGKQGLTKTPFSEAMRGKVEPDSVVETALNALEQVKGTRSAQYKADFAKLPKNVKVNLSDTNKALSNELSKFRITIDKKTKQLDFSNSPIRNKPDAVNDIKTVYEDITRWKDFTPEGVDALKRGFDPLYSPTSPVRSFVTTMRNSVKNAIVKQVSGYEKMTANYEKVSNLINEFRSGLSLGGRASTDTTLRKIISTMRQDNDFRLQLINQLETLGKQELTQQAAGTQLNPLAARGLVGRGAEIGAVTSVLGGLLSPKILIGLLATSPRVVGEFVQALGYGSAKTKAILNAINKLGKEIKLPVSPLGNQPSDNNSTNK